MRVCPACFTEEMVALDDRDARRCMNSQCGLVLDNIELLRHDKPADLVKFAQAEQKRQADERAKTSS